MHAFSRKAGAALLVVGLTVVGLAAIARADAPDPITATGVIENVANGKKLTLTGTWSWPTHTSDCNKDRFGAGWAVDWNDATQPGNVIGQVNGQGPVIDVGAAAANTRNPADNAVKLSPGAPYCGTYDAAKDYNSGTIFATSHIYPADQATFTACLVTYDVHGKLEDGVPPPTDKDMIAGGSGRNGDNSVEKNGKTPGGNQCFTIAVTAAPDLTIDKDDAGATFTAGQNGNYTIKVTHVNGTVTGDITVTDNLPAGLTLVSASGTGWTCTGAAGASTFSCVRPSAGITAGASTPSINLVVAVNATASVSVTNTATVSNPSDTNAANNTDQEPTPIAPPSPNPDLSIDKDDAGNSFTAGQNGSYSLVVRHVAGTVTGDITVIDNLPTGLTFVSASGSGWDCGGNTVGGSTVSCKRPSAGITGGASTPPITLVVAVASSASGSVVNAATLSNPSDTNPANNRDEESTPIVTPPPPPPPPAPPAPPATPPDLSITKDDGGATFSVGQTGTYSIRVKHVAGSISGLITVTDPLPAGLTMINASGGGWTCSWGSTSLTCTRGPEGLTNGSSTPPITVLVNVTSAAPGQVVNVATVTNPSDTNENNNRDEELTTVVRPAVAQQQQPGTGANAGGGQVAAGPGPVAPADYKPAKRGALPATGGNIGGMTMFGLMLLLAGLAMSVRRPQRTS